MNWFQGCGLVDDIKARYRDLAKRWHPDIDGGDTDTMAAVNAEYHDALQAQHGTEQATGDSDETRTYWYHEARETAAMAKVQELLVAGLAGCEVWLIGVWVWVTGDTRANIAALKRCGLRWHSGGSAEPVQPERDAGRSGGRVRGRGVGWRRAGRGGTDRVKRVERKNRGEGATPFPRFHREVVMQGMTDRNWKGVAEAVRAIRRRIEGIPPGGRLAIEHRTRQADGAIGDAARELSALHDAIADLVPVATCTTPSTRRRNGKL